MRCSLLLFALALAGCAPPPSSAERIAALLGPTDSGVIAAAACPCSDITAATAADGHVEVFARSSSGALWRLWETRAGGSYNPANAQRLTAPGRFPVGAPIASPFGSPIASGFESIDHAPSVTLGHGDGLFHVFYVRSSDKALIERQGSGAGNWTLSAGSSHGSGFRDPVAVELSDGTLALFATGGDGQPRVSYRAPGGGWGGWQGIGTGGPRVTGRAAPLQTADGTQWLFIRDEAGATWYTFAQPGSSFGAWSSLGGQLQFPAAAALDANGLINLIGAGVDGQIWLALQNEQDWGFGAWTPLVPGTVGGVDAVDSAPVIGSQLDPVAGPTSTRLELFFTNNSGNGIGSFFSVAQISPGSWINRQTSVLQLGGAKSAPADSAVATEGDGRLTGFSLDAGGRLRFARAARPVVSTTRGDVIGRYQGRARVFKGIPYAQAPVQSLRWRAPQPIVANWGLRDAGNFASICPQWSHPTQGNEDCLYLNVFTPSNAAVGSLPVMLFVHGGSNVNGSAIDYDGASLVNRAAQLGTPVVVVTIQYRLGVFGFLAYGGHGNGNYGLLDQIAALGWVQNNIARFGGDPARVMLFGQSAGGGDAVTLAASPLTRGRKLFWAAASESGGDERHLSTLAEQQQAGAQLASALNCAPPNDWACLLAAPTVALVAATTQLPSSITPSIDGNVLDADLETSLAQNLEVPLIIGTTRDERANVSHPETPLAPADYATHQAQSYAAGNFFDETKPFDAAVAPAVLALYPPLSPDSVWQQIALASDSQFTCSARQLARVAATAGQPVYRYLFTHAYEDPNSLYDGVHTTGSLGAFHTSELPFVFSSLGSYRATPAELTLSDTIVGYWTRFAATRDPNGGGAPAWAPYASWSATSDPLQLLDDVVQPSTGYHIAQCDYFARWY